MTADEAAGQAAAGVVTQQPVAMAIHARGLVAAHGLRPVLRDLDLDIPAGATVALLGGNGTGKSTLLRLLAGLRSPRAGTLTVLGHALPAERWALRGQVGLVAHHPLLYKELTVAENLRYHAGLHGLPASRVHEVIAMAELEPRADQPVAALSRGLVQRASVARALLADPPLLLLDEPLANLDPVVAELVGRLLGPREGRTRVIASHDPARALDEADHVIVLGNDARPSYVGAANAITVPQVEAMYR
ncbi:MAG: ABC transporter ATP-binding protein [Solirubrobacteraceae bacterium]|nr:ABC transporter ATP-binding protein [Solirubrobacteraceae bacterium]